MSHVRCLAWASAVVAADFATKKLLPTWPVFFHQRHLLYAVAGVAIAVVLIVYLAELSPLLVGLVAGCGVANAADQLANGGAHNPLVIAVADTVIGFNVADACAIVGILGIAVVAKRRLWA